MKLVGRGSCDEHRLESTSERCSPTLGPHFSLTQSQKVAHPIQAAKNHYSQHQTLFPKTAAPAKFAVHRVIRFANLENHPKWVGQSSGIR